MDSSDFLFFLFLQQILNSVLYKHLTIFSHEGVHPHNFQIYKKLFTSKIQIAKSRSLDGSQTHNSTFAFRRVRLCLMQLIIRVNYYSYHCFVVIQNVYLLAAQWRLIKKINKISENKRL